MYVLVGRYSGLLTDFICDVSWNPPGWGGASIQQTTIPARLSMIIAIRPGGMIPPHCDDPARENAIECALTRFHLVLQSNRHCWNLHDGVWQQLEVGGVYQMDPTKEHASLNWGETTRYHLVLDTDEPTWQYKS